MLPPLVVRLAKLKNEEGSKLNTKLTVFPQAGI